MPDTTDNSASERECKYDRLFYCYAHQAFESEHAPVPALDAGAFALRAQPTREQIEALKQRVPMRVGGDNMDMAAGWVAAIDAVLAVLRTQGVISEERTK